MGDFYRSIIQGNKVFYLDTVVSGSEFWIYCVNFGWEVYLDMYLSSILGNSNEYIFGISDEYLKPEENYKD